jgi:hypothetical protein
MSWPAGVMIPVGSDIRVVIPEAVNAVKILVMISENIARNM